MLEILEKISLVLSSISDCEDNMRKQKSSLKKEKHYTEYYENKTKQTNFFKSDNSTHVNPFTSLISFYLVQIKEPISMKQDKNS